MLDFVEFFSRSGPADAGRDDPADAVGAPVARLAVTSGRHAGAKLTVRRSGLNIGSAMTSDVILTDPGVLPNHAALEFMPGTARGKSRSVTVEAVEGLVVAGAEQLESGRSIVLALPCTLRIGGCEIKLTAPDPNQTPAPRTASAQSTADRLSAAGTRAAADGQRQPRRQSRWLLPLTVMAALSAAGLAVLARFLPEMLTPAPGKTERAKVERVKVEAGSVRLPVATPLAMSPPGLGTPVTAAPSGPPAPLLPGQLPGQLPAPVASKTPGPVTVAVKPGATAGLPVPGAMSPPGAPPPVPAVDSIAPASPAVPLTPSGLKTWSADPGVASLQQRLQQAGLDKALVADRRNGALVVEGTVGSEVYGRWYTVKQALAAGGTDTRGIIDLVKTTTASSLPRGVIASVVLGKAPYVMSSSGKRARTGDILEDGWSVESITAQTVTLRRGQAVTMINPANGDLR